MKGERGIVGNQGRKGDKGEKGERDRKSTRLNSSQDYLLIFKNSVIASIFVLIHMARNHFITHDGFPYFVQKEPNCTEI